jgi:hypothetical protein
MPGIVLGDGVKKDENVEIGDPMFFIQAVEVLERQQEPDSMLRNLGAGESEILLSLCPAFHM